MPFDYTVFPAKYRPPMDDKGKRIPGAKIALLEATPLKRLPPGLKPRLGFHLQPPMFHYGWAVPHGHIKRVGETHGFLVLEYPDDPSDDESEEAIEFEKVWPNHDETLEKLIPMLRERGVHTIQPEFSVIAHSPPIVLSLTTNYLAGNRTPPSEEVAIIQEFLEFDSPPGWYLDGPKGHWQFQGMRYVK